MQSQGVYHISVYTLESLPAWVCLGFALSWWCYANTYVLICQHIFHEKGGFFCCSMFCTNTGIKNALILCILHNSAVACPLWSFPACFSVSAKLWKCQHFPLCAFWCVSNAFLRSNVNLYYLALCAFIGVSVACCGLSAVNVRMFCRFLSLWLVSVAFLFFCAFCFLSVFPRPPSAVMSL